MRASVFNFERLDILRDSMWHPCKKLLSLEISKSLCYQLWASRYITGFNRTSDWKVIVDLILVRASILNFERLDILRDTIEHPSKKLMSLEISQSFRFQIRASRYIMGFIRASELKVIVVWFCSKLQFWISSVTIYYGIQSDIWVKSYCCLILLRASILNFERLDILRDSFEHPSKKLLSFDFA